MVVVSDYRQPRHEGRIVYLPTAGRVIICSDLHGHIHDFERLLERTRLVERLKAGEELYLIITGDIPDTARHRFFDPQVPNDGDHLILLRLMQLSSEYPNRIVYLEGNHDFHLSRLTREVRDFHQECHPELPFRYKGPINPTLLRHYIMDYKGQFGELLFRNNVAPYDMLERITETQLGFLTGGPILAILPSAKVLITHAGPVRMAPHEHNTKQLIDEIAQLDREELLRSTHQEYYQSPFHQLLNHRFPDGDYTLDDIQHFCAAFSVNIMLTGHTPLSYLGEGLDRLTESCRIANNFGWVGQQQGIFCTSFGALNRGMKVYFELDLGRPIKSLEDLRPNEDIISLYSDNQTSAEEEDREP